MERKINLLTKINQYIITNGSSSHQRDKIRQLGMGKWVTNNAIYISSEVGSAKPKRTIFDLAAKGRSVNDFIYVGDSFSNDIVGAKSAGWKTIWFNRRGRKSSFSQIQTDYEVRTLSELIEVIELLMNST
ncbi:HAD family hydrolase [Streptococcus hyovaginalis]